MRRLPGRLKLPNDRKFSIEKWEIAGIFAVLMLGLVIWLPHLDRGLSYDEIFTALHFVEVDSLWMTISTYHVFNNHIAYSILAFLSRAIFGEMEWALRLPAFMLGLGGIFWLWVLSRRLFGAKVAILAALGMSLSPAYAVYSVSARGYTGMILFTLLSSDFYLRVLQPADPPSIRRFAIIYSVTSVVAIYFHLYAALLILVQAFTLLLLLIKNVGKRTSENSVSQNSIQVLSIAFPVIGVSSLILYAPVLEQMLFWIGRRGQGIFRWRFPLDVIGELSGRVWFLLVMLILFVVLVGFYALLKTSNQTTMFLLLMLFIPLGLVWLSRPLDLYPRFFIYYLPYYLIFFSAGLLLVWHKVHLYDRAVYRLILSGLVACLSVAIFASWGYSAILLNNAPEAGFRDVVHAMEDGAKPTTQLCVIGLLADVYDYYATLPAVRYSSVDEFIERTEGVPEIRCAMLRSSNISKTEQQIVDWLNQNAEKQSFGRLEVFIFRK